MKHNFYLIQLQLILHLHVDAEIFEPELRVLSKGEEVNFYKNKYL